LAYAVWFAKNVPSFTPISPDASDEEAGLSFPKPEGFLHVWID